MEDTVTTSSDFVAGNVAAVTNNTGGDDSLVKEKSEAEYESKGTKTKWMFAALAIVLIIIFGIAMLVFFIIGNKPQMHEIAVVNNCSQPINVLVGTETSPTTLNAFEAKRISPGQVAYYYATPAVYLVVQGYYDDTLTPGATYPYPLTKAMLWFGNEGFNGTTQITDGSDIMDVPRSNTDNGDQSVDYYSVSMQDGFNVQMGIVSTNFNNKDPSNMFSCVGPNWYYNIGTTGVTATICPSELRYPETGYQACMSPCLAGLTGGPQFCCSATGSCGISGGCQNSWSSNDYYTLFHGACPNCMVTNCDVPLYQCGSSGGLTQYTITFCPT